MDTLHHSFSIIAISETWARDDNDVFLQISWYNFVSNNRNDRGSGVALYVRSNMSYMRREDLCKTDRECYESVFIEISNVKKCKIIVGYIYRPPGQDVRKFNDQFEVLIQNIASQKAESLLAGDYNINMLNYETHVDTEIFVNNLYSSSFLPLITRPTRFTTTTANLIDNIMSNAFNDDLISGILIADVS